MKIQVLVAAMNLEKPQELFDKLNIKNSAIIINQVTKEGVALLNEELSDKKVYSYNEKGLSKSRNKAIEKSDADICVVADDDMEYVENFEQIIEEAYAKHPDADIIAFYVESAPNSERKKSKLKEGKVGYLLSLKVQSVQMTFKRNKIVQSNLRFDENFGAGTDNYMGEENIFLYDCLKKGLKIYSVPIKIASLKDGESTWFKGFNEKYLQVKGAMFYRMSKLFCDFFILQFAVRRYKLFKGNVTFTDVLKNMFIGKRKYIDSKKVK